jgi:hypothetical protein
MKILKLNDSHLEQIKKLYQHEKFMGVDIVGNFDTNTQSHRNYMLTVFYRTYLTGLNNFHAYGLFNDNNDIEC